MMVVGEDARVDWGGVIGSGEGGLIVVTPPLL